MALSYRSRFGDGHYRELATLGLPGPALVIDVRQGSEHEPPLIWNLTTELDDFMLEMELQHVYRWRRLSDCLALFKLNPLPSRNVDTYEYVLTDPRGTDERFQGQDQLAEGLREKVGLVRGHRMSAINDWEQPFPTESSIDPDRPTVHICFVVDAEDPKSLTSAATYAEWLKQAEYCYDEQWNWRSPPIKTVVICLNVDPYSHSPQVLAGYFRRHALPFALDKTILLYRYGDNGVLIDAEMQSHQVELILYVLLLHGLEMLDIHPSQHHKLFSQIEDEDKGFDSWPIDLIGISSLEYSARWGKRWLDYGLVARISQILLNPAPNQSMETPDPAVHSAWLAWESNVEHFVAEELASVLPSLQVLRELPAYLVPRTKKSVTTNQPDVQALVQRYIEGSKNLAEALNSIATIIEQLQQGLQRKPLAKEKEAFAQLRVRWQELLARTAQLPAALLLLETLGGFSSPQINPQGLLPRAQQHAISLINTIRDIEDITQNFPDLAESRDQVNKLALLVQPLPKFFSSRKMQNQYEQNWEKLAKRISQDIRQVQNFIAAQIKLTLLKTVGLYSPNGKLSSYQLRLEQLTQMLRQTEREAQSIHEKAYDRLQLSLSQEQASSARGPVRPNPHSRVDLLDWPALHTAFAQLSEELPTFDSSLPSLSYWLLCLLNGANPEQLMGQQLQNHLQTSASTSFEQDEASEIQRGQLMGTLLMAILLLPKKVEISTTSIQALAKQYMDLVRSLDVEPSSFINIIERLQREGRSRQSGERQRDSLVDYTVRLEEPLSLLLSTWVNSRYIDRPQFNQMLAHNALFARMTDTQIAPDVVFADLRRRNTIMGYTAPMIGEESAYLLLSPNGNSKQFLQEIDISHIKHHLHISPLPDIEKLVYLRVHHLVYQWENDLPPVSLLPGGESPHVSSGGQNLCLN